MARTQISARKANTNTDSKTKATANDIDIDGEIAAKTKADTKTVDKDKDKASDETSWQSLKRHMEALKSAFSPTGVACSVGTFTVHPRDLVLYYGKAGPNEVSHRLDFSTASEDDLRTLATSCDPATFGRNSEAVYDETYRKAGKLDLEHFSANFDPERCGLMDRLRPLLLEGHRPGVGVRSELYKLNVYGPGSFFKAHKDTPRGDDMFASLVIVLPTRHEGGTLRFKQDEELFDFDSAKAVADATTPSIAYASFFSDIDHEVDVVKTGHRVTLTYNLYYTHASQADAVPAPFDVKAPLEDRLRRSLRALLDDPSVLPNSGLLGFSLRHQYTAAVLEDKRFLKGSDAVLAKVCDDLGLKASTRIIYKDTSRGVSVLLNKQVKIPKDEDCLSLYLIEKHGGVKLDPYMRGYDTPDIKIHWVTGRRRAQNVPVRKELVAAYGNEPTVGIYYWYVCFVVEVNRGGVDSADIGRLKPGETAEPYELSDDDGVLAL